MDRRKFYEYARLDERHLTSLSSYDNCDASSNVDSADNKDLITKVVYKESVNSDFSLQFDYTKSQNFECEEEWDIGGIPELLNELDADIENSPKINLEIHSTDIDRGNYLVTEKILSKKSSGIAVPEAQISINKLRPFGCMSIDENRSLHTSTFAGFSLRGLLIAEHQAGKRANTVNSNFSLNCDLQSDITGVSKSGHVIPGQQAVKRANTFNSNFKLNCDLQLDISSCLRRMSSQSGNVGNATGNAGSGGIANTANSQTISASSNSSKPNTKMSIDHQATLDKGLKMKIKRTKPGTKSSEAKHEIVKATEQQNGVTGCTVGGNSNPDDTSGVMPCSNLPSSQNSANTTCSSNTLSNTITSGTKKVVGNNSNQINNNMSTNTSASNSTPTANNASQPSTLGTKRGSSGHRRDKTKDKSTHSSRAGIDNKGSQCSDKDLQDKTACQCSVGDSGTSSCNSCIRKSEISMSQRLPNSGSNINSTTIPTGIFIPSAEAQSTAVSSANLLEVSTATDSSQVIKHSLASSSTISVPNPQDKEATNGANVKISAHIAAQLAAAATNFTNVSGLSNADTKILSAVVAQNTKLTSPGIISATVHHTISVPSLNVKTSTICGPASIQDLSTSIHSVPNSLTDEGSPPPKRVKHNDCTLSENIKLNKKDRIDVCVGTSVGTITEPDCLGPCEPGTSVTLEGIVWHETEGGVLVVNVTWRGKTYVGTLLDCTRHDWAPPRFCDSPTDELDSRTPKGRGKRGRAVITPDLSNFTETRSSIYFSHSNVHSKLRNGASKGGRNSRGSNTTVVDKTNSGSSISSGNGGSTPSTSPTPRQEKRKSKDEAPLPSNVENDTAGVGMVNASGIHISSSIGELALQPQSLINPVTGLNVQISSKKFKTASPCPISPILLECPEHDCSKKYKHANGLRYHQSHAHGSASLLDDDVIADTDENLLTPIASPVSLTPVTVDSNLLVNNSTSEVPKPSALKLIDGSETGSKLSDGNTICLSVEHPIVTLETERDTKFSEICGEPPNTSLIQSKPSSGSSDIAHQSNQAKVIDSASNKIKVNTLLSGEKNNDNVIEQGSTGMTDILSLEEKDLKNENANLFGVDVDVVTENQTECTSSSKNSHMSESNDCQPLSTQNDKNKSQNQDLKIDCFNNANSDMSPQLAHIGENVIVSNKTLSSSQAICKLKKNRKSPLPEVNVEGFNTCSLSRDGVQSPAYSDISDDSTSVNEQHLLDKQQLKGSDILKKNTDLGIARGSCSSTSGQHTVSTPLSGYGVYQYYQQQQFLVQPSIDTQQSSKSSITTTVAQPVIPASVTAHNTPAIAEYSKKDHHLELKSNPNLSQPSPDTIKDIVQAPANIDSNQATNSSSGVPSMGHGTLNSPASSKSVSHFYAFNYMSPSYNFNVEQNYLPVQIASDDDKVSRQVGILSPVAQQDQQSTTLFKDDRGKEICSPNESSKFLNQQIMPNKLIKPEPISKSEVINSSPAQVSHIPMHSKDMQGLGVYTNMYQRHPMGLSAQQLTREEELRRYYIFSDQQRRQNSGVHNINIINTHAQGPSTQSNTHQVRDDSHHAHPQNQNNCQQQQIKIKSTTSLTALGNGGKTTHNSKESPKQKQDEEAKTIKQEGQKPTMETQGPPPPPTSQYFLHPSYIASTPFGFDPNHPMYRNVLMPTTSPYNTAPYHLPMTRFHSPEDLSRNTGTKALDALHHAASQYYTTHKIHELSERALKSPNSSNGSAPNTIKVSVSSPTVVANPHSVLNANQIGHHPTTVQSPISSQLTHNLPSQTMSNANKLDVLGQKTHGNVSSVPGASHNETQKPLASSNSTVVTSSGGVNTNNSGGNGSCGSATDSRSPPPQRHVHTHHHTHVGLGYPMYPAPYGAAVLASQQAAAVAVINPFPPAPTK